MKIWHSLKYRIALIIFLLEAVMMGSVLWATLSYSLDKSAEQLASSESAVLNLVGSISRIALLTEEYADLQPYIESVLSDEHILRVVLIDAENRVVASTQPADVGGAPPQIQETVGDADEMRRFWRVSEIGNSAGLLGVLAIEFSHDTLIAANAEARNLGLSIAIAGMLIIAVAGIATGHFLTRRLERLTQAAQSISKGDMAVDIAVSGVDEVGILAGGFREMVGNVAESQQRLRDQAEHFKLLLDSTGEGIFGLDPDGNCSFCNAACLELLGYGRADELIGRNMEKVLKDGSADRAQRMEPQESITDAMQTGERRHVTDGIFWRADGSHFVAEYRAVPLDKDGKVVGAVVSFTDVTELRESEDALQRSQKMASVAQLTGGIAHDFNNILGIAVGNLELIKHTGGLSPKLHKRVEPIDRALERGRQLTRRLLLFASDTPKARSPVDLNKVIEGMDNLIAKSLTPQISINLDLADDLWLTEIDPGDFEDVLINLALNARDAMDGAGKLVIETENTSIDDSYQIRHPEALPGDYVAVTVSDTGTGITGDIIDQIFEPFFTTKEKGKGTGLGLSMAYGFVKRQNGIIDVSSAPGEGASIHLYLPRSLGTEVAEDKSAAGIEEIAGGTETILIVEDEPDLLSAAEATLAHKGYTIRTAGNAADALKILESDGSIDLLFSDIVMPGGQNGLELAVEAKNNQPGLKVVLTSGFSENVQHDGDHGDLVSNLLHKPYRAVDLARRIRERLDNG